MLELGEMQSQASPPLPANNSTLVGLAIPPPRTGWLRVFCATDATFRISLDIGRDGLRDPNRMAKTRRERREESRNPLSARVL